MIEDRPPRELIVDAAPAPGDSSDGSGTAMAPVAITVGVAGMLAKFVSPMAGLAAIGASIAYFVVRRTPDEGRFVLCVEEGILTIRREHSGKETGRVRLDDVIDVTLDRKSRQAGPAASERTRIAFELRAPAESLFVPEDRLSPLEAQEWHAKVRVFLRKHGWMPESERGEV